MFGMTPWRQQHRSQGALQTRGDDPFVAFRREFDSLFNEFFNRLTPTSSGDGGWGLNVEDKGSEFLVEAEAPGFEAKDFEVNVTGDIVTVRAEKKQESKEEGTRYRSFERSFTLPFGTNSEKVDARYHNGVLELHLPKSPEAKGRRIEVKS